MTSATQHASTEAVCRLAAKARQVSPHPVRVENLERARPGWHPHSESDRQTAGLASPGLGWAGETARGEGEHVSRAGKRSLARPLTFPSSEKISNSTEASLVRLVRRPERDTEHHALPSRTRLGASLHCTDEPQPASCAGLWPRLLATFWDRVAGKLVHAAANQTTGPPQLWLQLNPAASLMIMGRGRG